MRYIFPYLVGLFTWVVFAVLVIWPQGALVLFGSLLFLWLILLVGIGRVHWYREWGWWCTYGLFFATSFGLILIMVSPTLRNLYIVGCGVLNGLLMVATREYVHGTNRFLARMYLPILGFACLLTFWQSAALIFFFQTSFGANTISAVGILSLVGFLIARTMLRLFGLVKSSERIVLLVITVTVAEFAYALTLLPFHYYVLAALLTSWYYFLVELILAGQTVTSRGTIFRRYSITLVIALALILLSARWQ